jgi:Tfp pilus assembly protein PilO
MSRQQISHDAIVIINEEKRELAIFVVITLVVLTVLIIFPIRLMALKVVQINNEIEGKKRIKEQLDTKINNFTHLNADYQEIREDLKDLSLVYPNKGDYSLFVSNVDEICKANYFKLRSVSISSERGDKGENPFEVLNFWSVNINVVGRRSDVVNLLEDIEAMPMYPTVTSFGYNNQLNDDGFLSFNILIRIYGVDHSNIYINI